MESPERPTLDTLPETLPSGRVTLGRDSRWRAVVTSPAVLTLVTVFVWQLVGQRCATARVAVGEAPARQPHGSRPAPIGAA